MTRVPKFAIVAMLGLVPTAVLTTAGPAAATTSLTASMNGASEKPRGDRDGRGTARITTDVARGRVCYRITLSKVGTVAAGHIHRGARGEAGAIVVAFFAKPTRRPRGCATASRSPSSATSSATRAGTTSTCTTSATPPAPCEASSAAEPDPRRIRAAATPGAPLPREATRARPTHVCSRGSSRPGPGDPAVREPRRSGTEVAT